MDLRASQALPAQAIRGRLGRRELQAQRARRGIPALLEIPEQLGQPDRRDWMASMDALERRGQQEHKALLAQQALRAQLVPPAQLARRDWTGLRASRDSLVQPANRGLPALPERREQLGLLVSREPPDRLVPSAQQGHKD